MNKGASDISINLPVSLKHILKFKKKKKYTEKRLHAKINTEVKKRTTTYEKK